MKLIAIEEHFLTPEIRSVWASAGDGNAASGLHLGELEARLDDLGADRVRLMDESGVDVQVLSLTTPGLQNLGSEAADLARRTNDLVASVAAGRPDRFDGFAALPTTSPSAAGAELERCVTQLGLKGAMLHGRSGGKNIDHQSFWPIFEAAEALKAPIFMHPQTPPAEVRSIYYSGFSDSVDQALANYGLGWHYEAGLQFVRMILAGVFDRFPELQVILGHWGEAVLFYLERISGMDRVAKLDRPIADYMHQNLYVTSSGMFSPTYLKRTVEIVGIERIIFSTDYPYQYKPGRTARGFVEGLDLDDESKDLFAHGNWERITS